MTGLSYVLQQPLTQVPWLPDWPKQRQMSWKRALIPNCLIEHVYHSVMFTILNVPAVVDGRGSLSSHMRHLANEACHTVRLFKQSSSICSYLRNGLILHPCMYNLLWKNKIVICPWLCNNIKIFSLVYYFIALLKDPYKSFACYI